MTLFRFALKVSGPIDAAISGIINAAFPLFFLPWESSVDWFGLPSLYAFLAPMAFFTALMPSYFGVVNGVGQRMLGSDPGPLQAPVRWRWWALRRGFFMAVPALALVTFVMLVFAMWLPDWRFSTPFVIGLDGCAAALLAYGFQVAGVLASRQL